MVSSQAPTSGRAISSDSNSGQMHQAGLSVGQIGKAGLLALVAEHRVPETFGELGHRLVKASPA